MEINTALLVLLLIKGMIAGAGWAMYNTERKRFKKYKLSISNPVNNKVNHPSIISNPKNDK